MNLFLLVAFKMSPKFKVILRRTLIGVAIGSVIVFTAFKMINAHNKSDEIIPTPPAAQEADTHVSAGSETTEEELTVLKPAEPKIDTNITDNEQTIPEGEPLANPDVTLRWCGMPLIKIDNPPQPAEEKADTEESSMINQERPAPPQESDAPGSGDGWTQVENLFTNPEEAFRRIGIPGGKIKFISREEALARIRAIEASEEDAPKAAEPKSEEQATEAQKAQVNQEPAQETPNADQQNTGAQDADQNGTGEQLEKPAVDDDRLNNMLLSHVSADEMQEEPEVLSPSESEEIAITTQIGYTGYWLKGKCSEIKAAAELIKSTEQSVDFEKTLESRDLYAASVINNLLGKDDLKSINLKHLTDGLDPDDECIILFDSTKKADKRKRWSTLADALSNWRKGKQDISEERFEEEL